MNFKDIINMQKLKSLKFTEYSLENNHENIGGGIYRMFDIKGKIIYVGKSDNLHRRLLQHFGKDTNTAYFIDEVDYVEIFQESSPIMRTLLEAILIAFNKPKYNDEVKKQK